MARKQASRKDISSALPANPSPSLLHTPVSSPSPSPAPQQLALKLPSDSITMHRSSSQTDIPLPITYTPTTHRISKAKKGKRVHFCEYPGCNKVFTRAEHRRRHELNHTPEALFRCTQHGCWKAFHRPDLLARHMERHEIDAQMQNTSVRQWDRQDQASMTSDSSDMTKCMPVDPSAGTYLAPASQPTSMSIGSIVAPGICPDLAGDCLMWSGMELHLQPRATVFQCHVHEPADDSPFYSSPDTCASPSSDGYPMPAPSRSSVPSDSTAIMDRYPKNILKTDLTSSPLPIHASLRCWDPSDTGLPTPALIPVSLEEDLMQPTVQCQYPSPTWTGTSTLSYEDSPLPPQGLFQTTMGWKAWTL